MAMQQAPSQSQIPSAESAYLDQSLESLELAQPEIANGTSTSTTRPEDLGAPSEERLYATHWGINE